MTIATFFLALFWLIFGAASFDTAEAFSVGMPGPECLDSFSEEEALFKAEPVSFRSDDVELKGHLYMPTGEGPFPAIVVMHGGGSNPAVLRSTPYWLAPRMAACGVAALVYDKRGTGDSGGDYAQSTFDDFVTDAGSAASVLQKRKDVDKRAIGVLGFSQGGRLAPVAASRYPVFTFVASVSGPFTPVEDTRFYALRNAFAQAGVADSTMNIVMPLWRKHFDAVASRNASQLEALDNELIMLSDVVPTQLLPPTSADIPATGIYNSMGRDYAAPLASMTAPWFLLYGELDLTVPVEASLEIMRHHMACAGNEDVQVHVVPGVGHGFVDPETGVQMAFDALYFEWILETVAELTR